MDFVFTREEEAFRKEVRQFLAEEIPQRWQELGFGGIVEETEESWAIVESFNRKLGERGWLALTWPKEYGGQERSIMEQLILDEELAYHRAPSSLERVITLNWVCPTIMLFGSQEQKRSYLPRAAKGELVFCLGYTEPGAGSDLAGLQTRAVQKGEQYVVNGQKTFTSCAHHAHYCFLAARTDPGAPKHKGISILIIDMKTPGITVRPLLNVHGYHHFNEVFFDNVLIPKDSLVGELNRGWNQLMVALAFERSAGIQQAAGARHMLEALTQYVKETRAAGKMTAEDPLVRHKLAEIAIESEVCRLLCYRTAWLQSKGQMPGHEALVAAVFARELNKRVAQVGTELLGLYSQLDGDSQWAPLGGKIMRDYLSSPAVGLGGGTSEIQRNVIAIMGLGLPRG